MPSNLGPDGRLLGGQSLQSPNGKYSLVMQDDGNLVLYHVGVRALWSTGTGSYPGGGVNALMQNGDGNLVLYLPGGSAIWASGCNADGDDKGSSLVLQNDGNLVKYRPNGVAAWASDTVQDLGGPITNSREEEVGNQKIMRTNVTLLRSGVLTGTCFSQSRHPTEGLRGRVFFVISDDLGRSHWISELFRCTTRGGVLDIFTPSSGQDTLSVAFPEAIGRLSSRIDIFHGTEDLAGGEAAVRFEKAFEQMKTTIKGAVDVYDEVKDLLPGL